MPRVPILAISNSDTRYFVSSAARGDVDAQNELSNLFASWEGESFECFLCGNDQDVTVGMPAFYLLPDPTHQPDYIAVGICVACHELPQLFRLAKARRILRSWQPGFRLSITPAKRMRL
jgi:hypothetical protein